MIYEAWRISYQSSEQAARAAYAECVRLLARIEAMKRQEPFDADSDVFRSSFEAALKAGNWPATRQGDGYRSPSTQIAWRIAFSTVNRLKLYLAPGAQPAQKEVAYLDLGTGGYMDIGTDLSDEQLASLPKGRHMLGIVGTYGVDGYVPAQPAPSVPEGWKLVPTAESRHPGIYKMLSALHTVDNTPGASEWESYAAFLAAAPEAKP